MDPLQRKIKIVKVVLCVMSFIFASAGIIIFATHCSISLNYRYLYTLIKTIYYIPPCLLMAVGLCVIIASFLGYFGAIKESTQLLTVCVGYMCVILLLEMIATAVPYLLLVNFRESTQTSMYNKLKTYEIDPTSRSEWDVLQERAKCCGVQSVNDWIDNKNSTGVVPKSCCYDQFCYAQHKTGCLGKVYDQLFDINFTCGNVAFAMAVLQTIGIFISIVMIVFIRRTKTEMQHQKLLGIGFEMQHPAVPNTYS